MKVVDQNIPAELYNQYVKTLGQAQVWHSGSDIRSISKRDWFELIHRRSPPRGAPSAAQLKVRAAFLKCVDCFNAMPRTGGAVPPALGYRSKEWWYAKSLDPPEQNWKRTEMTTWAGYDADPLQYEDKDGNPHDVNWFLQTDEQDFIDFYNEMKPKYGYPWSASNNPDQIVTKMNQIVCDEIDYDHWGDIYVFYTPGQTAKARKGVCDDQSALHYALTWRALKELEWTDTQINNRLSCIIAERVDNRHMYNWWKDNGGATKIIENTYDPGESPKVIGDMKYWGDDQAKFLIQKFDKGGHFEPVWTYPEMVLPLWYYNYFIKYSWAVFYDNDIPDWCVATSFPVDHIKDSYTRDGWLQSGYSYAAVWAKAYTGYTVASWKSKSPSSELRDWGWVWQWRAGSWQARIITDRTTLVFKPIDHVSETEWNKFETFLVKIERPPMGTDPTQGGAIKLIQTGQILEQVFGWLAFTIPKNITNYNEFDITFEGMCRNSGDLQPSMPPGLDSRYCGSRGFVSQVELICA